MKEREVSTGKLDGQSLAGVEESVVHNRLATGFFGRIVISFLAMTIDSERLRPLLVLVTSTNRFQMRKHSRWNLQSRSLEIFAKVSD